ncbi:MAG: insulinase family protein [Myxococcales bacterium]|nr:insulinase family protein [Myxococcales bacterium]
MRHRRLALASAVSAFALALAFAPPSRADLAPERPLVKKPNAKPAVPAVPSAAPAAAPTAKSEPKPAPKPDAPKPAPKPDAKPAEPKPTVAVAAPVPAAPAPAAPGLQIDVRRLKLDNGLRVVLSVDKTSPTVAVDVVYDVGARNEERGKSGFAHLFEHMMFQGSANVPKGDHFKLVTSHGGTLNGTTSEDRTNYFEMLPQSELALAVWLEADRMRSLDISQVNFENQRAVVKEEFRMRVENAPYVPAYFRLRETVYQGYWPYEHPAIGTMKDLDAAELPWVRAFHDAYYAPNNAVVSIAGDFDPAHAEALVRQYFGPISQNPNVPKYEPPAVPEQKAARGVVVEDAHAKLPAFFDGWVIPQARHKDHYALELAAMVLTDGESSRLHKLLVRDKAVAQEVSAEAEGQRGPDLFVVEAKIASSAKIADVQKLVDAEIARLGREGPTEAEMTKLKNRVRAKTILGLQTNIARAQRLAEFELYWGDAALLNQEVVYYTQVTAADVKRVVAKYLVPERRSRVEVKPAAAPAQEPKK